MTAFGRNRAQHVKPCFQNIQIDGIQNIFQQNEPDAEQMQDLFRQIIESAGQVLYQIPYKLVSSWKNQPQNLKFYLQMAIFFLQYHHATEEIVSDAFRLSSVIIQAYIDDGFEMEYVLQSIVVLSHLSHLDHYYASLCTLMDLQQELLNDFLVCIHLLKNSVVLFIYFNGKWKMNVLIYINQSIISHKGTPDKGQLTVDWDNMRSGPCFKQYSIIVFTNIDSLYSHFHLKYSLLVAPITNVIIFVTYLLLVTIDRYLILYVNTPTVTSDLSSQANMLVNVIGTISIGLIFMLIATGCYFFIQTGPLANLGAAVCVICLILSIIFKLSVDKRYQRALSHLTQGTYEATGQLYINPVNKYQWYYEKETFCNTQFNIKNDEERLIMNTLIKYQQSKKKQIKYDESSKNKLNKKEVQKDDSTYKQNYFDKLLGKIHADLTILPVSQVIVDDHKLGEVRCKVLNFDDQLVDTLQTVLSNKNQSTQFVKYSLPITECGSTINKIEGNDQTSCKLSEQYTEQDINFMASYTHPALLQQANMK
ncbi:Transmembrane_domain-containing protein [Hexamita inflata]|uniref:Transmembrane domain-containing protein n=1 Tax=Hexamita inflata TaxID=28002 RepID=A0AA86Q9C0_9EUKA|nr:Transmembrane domain-containing protein [Hexamita inflata]